MAVFYAQDFKVTIGTVNLSSYVTAVTLEMNADEVETRTASSVDCAHRSLMRPAMMSTWNAKVSEPRAMLTS